MTISRLALLPVLLVSFHLFAQTDQELVGEWTMTRMKSTFHDKFGRVNSVKKDCAGCESYRFNADHTYTWSNNAIQESGQWRRTEDDNLVLFDRTVSGEAADESQFYLLYKKGVLTIRKSDTDRLFMRK